MAHIAYTSASIRTALAHTSLPQLGNIEKPLVFSVFELEMLKNRSFLKLWGHLDRDENDFDSFFTPNMRKNNTSMIGTRPRKCRHAPLLRASVNAPVASRSLATSAEAIDRELLSLKIKRAL